MWIPERVWEQTLTQRPGRAGIQYTMLDDFHFKNAGLTEDELFGYYVTEDEARLVAVFPGSERLRYTIPFAEPQETIDYLRGIAEQHPGAVAVLRRRRREVRHLAGNEEARLRERLADAVLRRAGRQSQLAAGHDAERCARQVPPLGKVYLPDGSYREMTEWALPTARLVEYEELRHEMEHEARWPNSRRFVRGGFWRNFKVKYPETDEMYCRMHDGQPPVAGRFGGWRERRSH